MSCHVIPYDTVLYYVLCMLYVLHCNMLYIVYCALRIAYRIVYVVLCRIMCCMFLYYVLHCSFDVGIWLQFHQL